MALPWVVVWSVARPVRGGSARRSRQHVAELLLTDGVVPDPDDLIYNLEVEQAVRLDGRRARWRSYLIHESSATRPSYAIIVLALGAARAWFFPLMSPAVGHSLLLGLWLAVAGTLFVIPTAGEMPIVQGLLAYGLGPFGAGALLITLPAVSLPSLVMIGRSFPRRTLAMVTLAVVVLGIVSGAVASLLGF